jgi:hypothetical protein
MPDYDDVHELLEVARLHVRATGHSVHLWEDARMRTLGFACSDCTTPDTIWGIGLRSVCNLHRDDPLRIPLSSHEGRVGIENDLNIGATNPPPVSYSTGYDAGQALLDSPTSPEEEVAQLENLWGAEVAATGLAEQTRRKIRDKEEYEARVHARVPTRFEREEVI